jgi:hypothetical protein
MVSPFLSSTCTCDSVGTEGVVLPLIVACGGCGPRDEWQVRLHSLTENGRVPAVLAARAAHIRLEPLEFAFEAVRSRGERAAEPAGRKQND